MFRAWCTRIVALGFMRLAFNFKRVFKMFMYLAFVILLSFRCVALLC